MKKIIFLAIVILQGLSVDAQSNTAQYATTLAKVQRYYNRQNPDSLFALFSANMKTALPLEKTKEMLGFLLNQTGKLNSFSQAEFTNEMVTYKGSFEKTDLNIFMKLDEENKLQGLSFRPIKNGNNIEKPQPVYNNNFNVVTNQGDTLWGTLSLGIGDKEKSTAVLFIAGSGPTDRDGNNIMGVNCDAFKMLADSLSKAGIASIRYDKRGVAASKNAITTEDEMRFEDGVNDALLFVQKIKKDSRFNKIFIVGHSEGSLVGMITANKEKVDGFISVAGAGEDAGSVLRRQFKANNSADTAVANTIISSLKKGKTIAVSNQNLSSIFRPSVQPYLISWFAYDPKIELKKLSIPILILQGNTDLQTSVEDAQNLGKAQPKARLIIIDQMNHVLKTVSNDRAENLATYNNPALPIDADLSKAIIDFCLR